MPEPFDKETVLRLLERLRRKDSKRRVFGSAAHDYELNPPIPVSTIEEFETRHGIRLPEEYRYFITEIGNGGAGPAYGWNDYRADHGGIVPLWNDSGEQMTFSDWYMSWLNESLQKAGAIARAAESLRWETVTGVHAPVRLRSRRSELLTLLGLIVAGVLLALLLALLRG